MRNLVVRLLINAGALWAAARWVEGLSLNGSFANILLVALLFGLVNAVVKPIVRFLSFPLIIVTLGLATFAINGAMLWLTSLLTSHLGVADFRAALLGSLVISLVSWLLSVLLPDEKQRD